MMVSESTENVGPCPSCGHCPTCGRGGVTIPQYPMYPTYPWYPQVWNSAGYTAASVT